MSGPFFAGSFFAGSFFAQEAICVDVADAVVTVMTAVPALATQLRVSDAVVVVLVAADSALTAQCAVSDVIVIRLTLTEYVCS